MAYRNMDDTPDSTLAVLLEHLADILVLGEVRLVDINLSTVLVLGGGIRGEFAACEVCDTVEGLGAGVVVVINGDDLVATSLLQGIDDVGA